jgi:hypothetical protein
MADTGRPSDYNADAGPHKFCVLDLGVKSLPRSFFLDNPGITEILIADNIIGLGGPANIIHRIKVVP